MQSALTAATLSHFMALHILVGTGKAGLCPKGTLALQHVPRPCSLCFISRITCIALPAWVMRCKFRHQFWVGFSCIRSFIWGKQISCTSTTNNPTQPSVHTCKATESSPLRWVFPRGNAAVSCKSRRITCALCPYVPVTSWDTAGNGCYPSGGTMLPPHLSPGAHEEGGGNFRNSHPRTGKAFSMFLAEISLSTSLPVLLLPVRPVTEEMLTPGTPARIWCTGRETAPAPLWGMNSSISRAVSCEFKTKK